MVAFLTDAWVAALHEAASGDAALADATRDVHLVVEERVRPVPHDDGGRPDGAADERGAGGSRGEVEVEGEVVFHVVLDRGRVAVVPGPAAEPTVRFTQDRATATAIAAGEESAQRAFMTGRLQVGGDLRALVEHQAVLASLHDVFAYVRARTELG